MAIQVMPLGSGQDVGRSCVIVSMGGRTIMFDCGMHMGRRGDGRYPNFSLLSKTGRYTEVISAVIITHFHIDHIGALPYFTEVCGYNGPIYMTLPTRAIAPIMLEDYHKIMMERPGEKELFTRQHIVDCMRKVTAVDLHQEVMVGPSFSLTPYYAGHVLGAAMYHVKVGHESVVYTGDYNTSPDRHLGPAALPRLRPDLLITEATYATTLRDSKRGRERALLAEVHDTVSKGGKVLIPTFAVGRAQELFMLLDEYWERMGLQVPIYFSSAMASRANLHYRLLLSWAHPNLADSSTSADMADLSPAGALPGGLVQPASAGSSMAGVDPSTGPWVDPDHDPSTPLRQPFSMKRAQPWARPLLHAPGPAVLFASPGMLNAGVSLEAFRAWAGHPNNLVLLPGFQVAGTIGAQLQRGHTQELQLDAKTSIDVKCKVHAVAFSAHADAKGIMQLLAAAAPAAAMLVHGEAQGMKFLKEKVRSDLGIDCYDPPDGMLITVRTKAMDHMVVHVPRRMLKAAEQEAAASRAMRRLLTGASVAMALLPGPPAMCLRGILLATPAATGTSPGSHLLGRLQLLPTSSIGMLNIPEASMQQQPDAQCDTADADEPPSATPGTLPMSAQAPAVATSGAAAVCLQPAAVGRAPLSATEMRIPGPNATAPIAQEISLEAVAPHSSQAAVANLPVSTLSHTNVSPKGPPSRAPDLATTTPRSAAADTHAALGLPPPYTIRQRCHVAWPRMPRPCLTHPCSADLFHPAHIPALAPDHVPPTGAHVGEGTQCNAKHATGSVALLATAHPQAAGAAVAGRNAVPAAVSGGHVGGGCGSSKPLDADSFRRAEAEEVMQAVARILQTLLGRSTPLMCIPGRSVSARSLVISLRQPLTVSGASAATVAVAPGAATAQETAAACSNVGFEVGFEVGMGPVSSYAENPEVRAVQDLAAEFPAASGRATMATPATHWKKAVSEFLAPSPAAGASASATSSTPPPPAVAAVPRAAVADGPWHLDCVWVLEDAPFAEIVMGQIAETAGRWWDLAD